jgi:hypothetical protein
MVINSEIKQKGGEGKRRSPVLLHGISSYGIHFTLSISLLPPHVISSHGIHLTVSHVTVSISRYPSHGYHLTVSHLTVSISRYLILRYPFHALHLTVSISRYPSHGTNLTVLQLCCVLHFACCFCYELKLC